jgi:hypothetical protein
MLEEQFVNTLSSYFFEVFFSRIDDQIRCRDRRKAVRGTRPAEQAGEQRFLEIGRPFQAPLVQGPQQCHPPAGDTRFLSCGAEGRAGDLAESASIAHGNRLIVFGNLHRGVSEIGPSRTAVHFLPGRRPGAKMFFGSSASFTLCITFHAL